jgi:hypothetical protein
VHVRCGPLAEIVALMGVATDGSRWGCGALSELSNHRFPAQPACGGINSSTAWCLAHASRWLCHAVRPLALAAVVLVCIHLDATS